MREEEGERENFSGSGFGAFILEGLQFRSQTEQIGFSFRGEKEMFMVRTAGTTLDLHHRQNEVRVQEELLWSWVFVFSEPPPAPTNTQQPVRTGTGPDQNSGAQLGKKTANKIKPAWNPKPA